MSIYQTARRPLTEYGGCMNCGDVAVTETESGDVLCDECATDEECN